MISLRTCIACREKKPKGDLLNITRTSSNGIVVGELAFGRSIYICRKKECLEKLLKHKRDPFSHFLKTKTDPQAILDRLSAVLK